MMMMMKIRDALPEEALAACVAIIRSIAELCGADHHNDPKTLERWLGNKMPESFRSLMLPPNSLLVALEGDAIVAVGSVTGAGEITFNCVSPDVRFSGVSTAMLAALETRATERGNERCTLTSTETARRFYLARGYREDGPAAGNFGTASGYPMSKRLIENDTTSQNGLGTGIR
jgi:GNAT superfamily N-acetyltransferase